MNGWSAYSQVGLAPNQSSPSSVSPGAIPGIGRATGPAATDSSVTSAWSLRNPLVWFGIFAATTAGLIGFSSTARVGKARGSIAIGKEK